MRIDTSASARWAVAAIGADGARPAPNRCQTMLGPAGKTRLHGQGRTELNALSVSWDNVLDETGNSHAEQRFPNIFNMI